MKEQTLWLLRRVTGVLLFLGLGLHFYTMHFMGDAQLTHDAILARLNHPGWTALNVTLLGSAIVHGMSGLWGIAIEYIAGRNKLKAVGAAIISLSIILLLAGIRILMTG